MKLDTSDKNILCGLTAGMLPVICSIIGFVTGHLITISAYLISFFLLFFLLNAPESSDRKEKSKIACCSFPVFLILADLFQIYEKLFAWFNAEYTASYGFPNIDFWFGLWFVWIPLSIVMLVSAVVISGVFSKYLHKD